MEPVVTPDSRKIFRSPFTKQRAESGQLIPIGGLATRTRCNIETIRFYEKIAVLPKPARTEGGHRAYGPAHVERLIFVRRARELGFTLEEVRALLCLADERERPCDEVKTVAYEHLAEVQAKIADLRAMELALTSLIAQCAAGDGTKCPLIEALARE
jgi:MerR family mercuric resistance operon transcriptional regulator